jgi:xanthine dehydrogenase accessory factor
VDGQSRRARHGIGDAMATGLAWHRDGGRVAVATVTATRRSAPRPVGTKMVVADDGRLAGSVSGGCVEAEVVQVAAEVLTDGRPRHRSYGISDDEAFGVGLPCGGEIDIYIEALDAGPAVCRLVDGARRGAVVTVLDGADAGRRLIVDLDEALAPDASTAVVILTHEQRFDVTALLAALATPAFYVGAMGSRRTQRRRTPLLLEAGLAATQLERIHGPCGLDVGGATPPETALSILAEILAVRAGRGGGPLRRGSGSIHQAAEPPVVAGHR